MFKKVVQIAVFAATAISVNALAAHSDVATEIENNAFIFEEVGIIVNSSGFITDDGAPLYETEFGEGFNPANFAIDPGFEVHDGSLTPGQYLGFEVKDTLNFWNGSIWSTSTSSSLLIKDLLFNGPGDPGSDDPGTTVTDNIITNSTGLIGQADGGGGVHAHIGFEIINPAASGAYLLELALQGFESDQSTSIPGLSESDTFYIAFNYNLDEDDFEKGIRLLGVTEIAAVPLPAAWLFFASGLGTLLLGRRAKV